MIMISYIIPMIIMSIISLCWWRKNIVILLLSLEMLLMSLFILICNSNFILISISILMMATIMVSGSSMGLAFLVSLSRSHNSTNCSFIWSMTFDNISYFNTINNIM